MECRPLRSRLVFDRPRSFLPDRMSECRGARGWAEAARSEIHKLIPHTQKTPQPISFLTDLTQQLIKHPGRVWPGDENGQG